MKTILATLAAGSLGALAVPASAADLSPAPYMGTYDAFPALSTGAVQFDDDDDDDWRDRRRYRGGRGIYDRQGRYHEPRRIRHRNQMWRGRDGRYYCKRDNGTTGLVIGAGVGALAGHEVAGRGDKTLGAILGGALGAIIGREIDRGSLNCR